MCINDLHKREKRTEEWERKKNKFLNQIVQNQITKYKTIYTHYVSARFPLRIDQHFNYIRNGAIIFRRLHIQHQTNQMKQIQIIERRMQILLSKFRPVCEENRSHWCQFIVVAVNTILLCRWYCFEKKKMEIKQKFKYFFVSFKLTTRTRSNDFHLRRSPLLFWDTFFLSGYPLASTCMGSFVE